MYSEEGNSVILTVSREDYDRVIYLLGVGMEQTIQRALAPQTVRNNYVQLLRRLNSGNPNYTPYQVEEKKSSSGD